MIEHALVKATGELIQKARIDVSAYTQTRHGKAVRVRHYTRSQIKNLTDDQISFLLGHPDASSELKRRLQSERRNRDLRNAVAAQPKDGVSPQASLGTPAEPPVQGRLAEWAKRRESAKVKEQSKGFGPPKRLRGRTTGGPKLTAQRRRELPAEQFGLPESRAYPLDTPGRARNAKVRAKQQLDKGHITQAQYDQIIQRADQALPKGKKLHRRKRRGARPKA